MATYSVTCAVCGNPFEASRAHAKYCSPTCRSRRSRAGVETEPPTESVGIVSVTEAELRKLERLDTVEGQQALALACRIASASSTSSAVATCSVELSRLMRVLRATAVVEEDELSRARRKSEQKRARAGAPAS